MHMSSVPSVPPTIVAHGRPPRHLTSQGQPVARTHPIIPMVLRHMTRSSKSGIPIALGANLYPPNSTCYTKATRFPEWREAMDLKFNAICCRIILGVLYRIVWG